MPTNPEGWLLIVARNRLTDMARGNERFTDQDELAEQSIPPRTIECFPDERLKLMFVCAHPAIDATVHTPLMLQTVLGLDAQTIGQAFLVPDSTMAKRLVRAKRKIRDAGISFQIPEPEELESRTAAVSEAIYGAFSRDWMEAGDLSEEAFFLATLLADMMPDNAEVLGLAALIAYALSREEARICEGGFVPLEEQDPSKWDPKLLAVAGSYLRRAQSKQSLGRFQLEAAIQAVHADRASTGITNWEALAQLHLGLSHLAPTIGATVGYAAALGKSERPEEGLAALYTIDQHVRASYAPAEATRAFLLSALGHTHEACKAYEKAIALTREPPLRQYLEGQLATLASTIRQ